MIARVLEYARAPAAAARLRRRRAPPRPGHLRRAGRGPPRAGAPAPCASCFGNTGPSDATWRWSWRERRRRAQGRIDVPIRDRYEGGRRGVARPGETGLPALTRYRVVERLAGGALLEIELETGRQHQIRAHLAHVGLPILGDASLRFANPRAAAPRQMLHARVLGFVHPLTGRTVRVESPLPADFERVLTALRRGAGKQRGPNSPRPERRVGESRPKPRGGPARARASELNWIPTWWESPSRRDQVTAALDLGVQGGRAVAQRRLELEPDAGSPSQILPQP